MEADRIYKKQELSDAGFFFFFFNKLLFILENSQVHLVFIVLPGGYLLIFHINYPFNNGKHLKTNNNNNAWITYKNVINYVQLIQLSLRVTDLIVMFKLRLVALCFLKL